MLWPSVVSSSAWLSPRREATPRYAESRAGGQLAKVGIGALCQAQGVEHLGLGPFPSLPAEQPGPRVPPSLGAEREDVPPAQCAM